MLALHDEAQAFAKETESLRRRGGVAAGIDKIAFLTTFKAVVLDGIAVVFIVIALGADGRLLVPAAVGAGLALAVVMALGLVVACKHCRHVAVTSATLATTTSVTPVSVSAVETVSGELFGLFVDDGWLF